MKKSSPSIRRPRDAVRPASDVTGAVSPPACWLDRFWPVVGLSVLALVLTLPLFAPWSWWPAGFFALVPWLMVLAGCGRSRLVYPTGAAFCFAYFLVHLRWLYVTTGPGYVGAALAHAILMSLVIWPLRYLHRERKLPLVWVVPVVWVAMELIRSRGPLAFPWFLLGHSQILFKTMIQCADLAGVEAVSFVLAAFNGWLAAGLLARFAPPGQAGIGPLRSWLKSGVGLAVLLLAVLGYGQYRLRTWEKAEGPRIAVVQGDFLLPAIRGEVGASNATKMKTYLRLTEEAAEDRPDMIVLPETPWSMVLNPEILESEPGWKPYQDAFRERAMRYGAYITVGGMSEEPQPESSYPAVHRYNSAFIFPPDGSAQLRYDKIHLVLFGEYVPFRHSRYLFWLYRFLNDSWFNPWGFGGVEYSLTAGKEFRTFTMHARSREGQAYQFGVTICYEDVIPHVFRRFVTGGETGKRVDFMLNISNDGWFGHGGQQPQHLVNCAFRAVENRVAIARAVNTGVSGFISPDGSWHDLITESPARPAAGGTGQRTATLTLDRRRSLYSQWGDWLAYACLGVTLLALPDAWWCRPRKGRGSEPLR